MLVTKFLKISLIQQNFHQFWWKKMCKIINKYCHQFRWNFHHLITHYFLWFTKKITRIGENSAKNSSENQDGLLPPRIATFKDKIPKNSILARIFGLRQGYKDKSCPGQDFRETRTEYHPCNCIPRYDQDAQGRQQHQVFINVE